MSDTQHPDSHGSLEPVEEPIPNPGLHTHTWRPTDVDDHARRRAERQVSMLFGLSALCTVAFVVSYFTFKIGDNWDTFAGLGASTVFLGVFLGLALLFIGFGIIQWARKLMGDQEIVEMRHLAASSAEDRTATVEALELGIDESGFKKYKMVRRSLLMAVGLLGAPAVVMLRDLGPLPQQVENASKGTGLNHTLWGVGGTVRVLRDVVGTPIRASDLQIGDLVNAVPDGIFQLHGTALQEAKAKGAVIVVKMSPDEIVSQQGGDEDWSVNGIVVYSKICSHVGCPISLYERTTHHVLCPCHQSTFDLADSAKVVFGPAARHLPQLPLGVDEEGFLVATKDFQEPVGPSYWERDR
ncbi:cytochrome bc1 complex Rieske iron-sulfur subunit [Nocardioides sp. GXZ039]|uniref:cytochrome bc1 complex Rieske iron-sulfur subunit n=1 Tax=Nocardioides sp. GXZ039 TaxID=3136018 RepID=UPI0030F49D5E